MMMMTIGACSLPRLSVRSHFVARRSLDPPKRPSCCISDSSAGALMAAAAPTAAVAAAAPRFQHDVSNELQGVTLQISESHQGFPHCVGNELQGVNQDRGASAPGQSRRGRGRVL